MGSKADTAAQVGKASVENTGVLSAAQSGTLQPKIAATEFNEFKLAVESQILRIATEQQIPLTAVQYAVMAAQFALDYEGMLQFVNDNAFATEVAAILLHKGLVETVVISDDTKRRVDLVRSDIASPSEYLATVVSFYRDFDDSASAQDQANRLFDKAADGDSVGVEDDSRITFLKLFEDSISLEDYVVMAFEDPEADTVVVSDVSPGDHPVIGFSKPLLDFAQTGDAVALQFGKLLDDAQGATDLLESIGLGKSLYDQQAVDDAALVLFGKGLADSVLPTELAIVDFSRPLADSQGIGDTSEILFGKYQSDGTSATDAVSAFDVGKGLSDAQALSDQATTDFTKSVSDSQSTSDAISADFGKSLSDTQSLSDLAYASVQKLLADSQTVADSVSTLLGKSFADAQSMTDASVIGVTKNLSDLSSATDAGSLRTTDYADITYFAEDYIGTQATF